MFVAVNRGECSVCTDKVHDFDKGCLLLGGGFFFAHGESIQVVDPAVATVVIDFQIHAGSDGNGGLCGEQAAQGNAELAVVHFEDFFTVTELQCVIALSHNVLHVCYSGIHRGGDFLFKGFLGGLGKALVLGKGGYHVCEVFQAFDAVVVEPEIVIAVQVIQSLVVGQVHNGGYCVTQLGVAVFWSLVQNFLVGGLDFGTEGFTLVKVLVGERLEQVDGLFVDHVQCFQDAFAIFCVAGGTHEAIYFGSVVVFPCRG